MKTADPEIKIVERLKSELIGELRLMTTAQQAEYWQRVHWRKPNLVDLAKHKSVSGKPTALAVALRTLPPEILSKFTETINPFGCLLDGVELNGWLEYCRTHGVPWMNRIWIAAASQLRAERRLIHKGHGWADAWEQARRNQDNPDQKDRLRYADEMFLAQLNHANDGRRKALLAMPALAERLERARDAKDEAFLRRVRNAKRSHGKRAGVSKAEKFLVAYWLEFLNGLPGLCFFSDSALHCFLSAFGLSTGGKEATKKMRLRLGLIQAGTKRHLVEKVKKSGKNLSLYATSGKRERMLYTFSGPFVWDGERRWPRSMTTDKSCPG